MWYSLGVLSGQNLIFAPSASSSPSRTGLAIPWSTMIWQAWRIFSFSLSLGDYLTPTLVGKNLFIGNAIDQLVGTAQNRPLAAAIATIPIFIIAVYLLIARAMGAFEAL